MQSVREVVLGLILCLMATGVAQADGVRALALPSRQGNQELQNLATEVAAELAARLGTSVLEDKVDPRLADAISDARQLAASGQLERAVSALGSAVTRALNRVHRVSDDATVLDAQVELAAVLIAVGENSRASAIFDRILVLDPGFELVAEESSPRLAKTLLRARRRAGRSPSIEVGALGESCRDGADVLVVARRGFDGSIELFRFDRCTLHASARTRGAARPQDLAASLNPGVGANDERPFYKSPWFWAGGTAVVVAGSVAAYFLFSSEDQKTEVVPIF